MDVKTIGLALIGLGLGAGYIYILNLRRRAAQADYQQQIDRIKEIQTQIEIVKNEAIPLRKKYEESKAAYLRDYPNKPDGNSDNQ